MTFTARLRIDNQPWRTIGSYPTRQQADDAVEAAIKADRKARGGCRHYSVHVKQTSTSAA